jgi:hypothetical protein
MKTASARYGEALHGFAGLAPHFGRSSKSPFRRSLFRGGRLPFHNTWPEGHQDNRVSIGKTTKAVNPIPLWKYDRFIFLLLDRLAPYPRRKSSARESVSCHKIAAKRINYINSYKHSALNVCYS